MRLRRFIKILGWMLLAYMTLWAGGLALYSARLDARPAQPVRADAGVVLTGGPGRIEAAVQLLRDGHIARLLVSGVHPDARLRDIAQVAAIEDSLVKCCIDLDHGALNTRGNAFEAARWANARGYQSLVIITADNHMPRALNIFHNAMPHMNLRPYVVPTKASFLGIVKEYSKYLWTLMARPSAVS